MKRGWAPRGGWRAFAGEVGVIVLGVLIALAAQQAVEESDRRQNRAFTEQALRGEIAVSAVHAFERIAIEPCLTARLRELDASLAGTGDKWRGMPARFGQAGVAGSQAIASVYRVPSRTYSSNAWTTAKASGVLLHMDSARVAQFSDIYSDIDKLQSAQDAENALTPALSFLARDQQLDRAGRIAAQSTLARLDAENAFIVTIAHQLFEEVEAMQLGYSETAADKAFADVIAVQRRYRGDCVRAPKLKP